MSPRPTRSRAEWASLAGSILVVLAFVGLIAAQIPRRDDPAAPVARVKEVERVGEAFHVHVEVRNEGDGTAADVQVAAELTVDEQTFSGDQSIDFLSGSQDGTLVFVFDEDPSLGQLRVTVTGFATP